MEIHSAAFTLLRLSGFVVSAWYLLLLYLFPGNLGYSLFRLELAPLYVLIFLGAFVLLAGSAVVYHVRIVRLLASAASSASQAVDRRDHDVIPSIEKHLILNIRRLAKLTIIEFVLRLVRDTIGETRGEELHLMSLIVGLPAVILFDLGFRMIVRHTTAWSVREALWCGG